MSLGPSCIVTLLMNVRCMEMQHSKPREHISAHPHRGIVHRCPRKANIFLRHTIVEFAQRPQTGVNSLDLPHQRGNLRTAADFVQYRRTPEPKNTNCTEILDGTVQVHAVLGK